MTQVLHLRLLIFDTVVISSVNTVLNDIELNDEIGELYLDSLKTSAGMEFISLFMRDIRTISYAVENKAKAMDCDSSD